MPKKSPVKSQRKDRGASDQGKHSSAALIASKWKPITLLVLAVLIAAAVYWYPRRQSRPVRSDLAQPASDRDQASRPVPTRVPKIPFSDITAAAGLSFQHENGAAGEKLLPETMGGGCAFLDYDSDGDQDIMLVNSSRWPWDAAAASVTSPSRLYQNDGAGNFTDVTVESGLTQTFYGMGVACGDFDNDGDVDLYFTAVGLNRLYRNDGGTFREITAEAGVGGAVDQWSTAAGWFDYDNDRDLDLFVCNYVQWSRDKDLALDFQLANGGRAYGRPQEFTGTSPYLYRNDGNGKFTDVSSAAGIQVLDPATGTPLAKSLGLTFADFDQDGWLDIVVANDTVQNQLFHNQRNGRFTEIGAVAGIAFDNEGNPRGAMGIDVAYFRNNDDLGIAIGNFANEMTALYVSRNHELLFTDEAVSNGLGPSSRLELKFGVSFADFDLDGRLDFVAANGHLEEEINKVLPDQHYEQAPHLYWNAGPGQESEFVLLDEQHCGPDFSHPLVGRGVALADIDGDGDVDVLITGSGQPPRLLRNNQQLGNHWLRLKLVGEQCNREAIGSGAEVHLAGQVLRRQVMPCRSYLSSSELPLTFGLGDTDQIDRIVIRWADGSQQELTDVAVDRLHVIQQPMSPAGASPAPDLRESSP